jgi:hypothetical protein
VMSPLTISASPRRNPAPTA